MVGEEHKRRTKFWRNSEGKLGFRNKLTTEEGRVEKEFKDDCLLFFLM